MFSVSLHFGRRIFGLFLFHILLLATSIICFAVSSPLLCLVLVSSKQAEKMRERCPLADMLTPAGVTHFCGRLESPILKDRNRRQMCSVANSFYNREFTFRVSRKNTTDTFNFALNRSDF